MISQGIMNVNKQYKIAQDIYIKFIENYLQQLERQANQYRYQFDTIKNCLPDYAHTIDDKIKHFVQNEGLIGMRLHFEMRIALIEYICLDRTYQLEYFQEKPANLQV